MNAGRWIETDAGHKHVSRRSGTRPTLLQWNIGKLCDGYGFPALHALSCGNTYQHGQHAIADGGCLLIWIGRLGILEDFVAHAVVTTAVPAGRTMHVNEVGLPEVVCNTQLII